ncbi:MAG TPA: UrcA family protein [Allosphingosinicella sp.]|nr:UrcA family protein [Allosphingosinicella sp.]
MPDGSSGADWASPQPLVPTPVDHVPSMPISGPSKTDAIGRTAEEADRNEAAAISGIGKNLRVGWPTGRKKMKLLSSTIAMLSSIIVTGVTLALSVGPAAARERIVITSPEQNDYTRTERVSYADLDLATDRGERVLTRRVSVAVQDVCFHDGEHPFMVNVCKRSAWQGAGPQMASAIQRARENPGLAMGGSITVAAR